MGHWQEMHERLETRKAMREHQQVERYRSLWFDMVGCWQEMYERWQAFAQARASFKALAEHRLDLLEKAEAKLAAYEREIRVLRAERAQAYRHHKHLGQTAEEAGLKSIETSFTCPRWDSIR